MLLLLKAEGGDSGNGGGFSYAAASVLFRPLAFCIVVGFALRIPYAAANVLFRPLAFCVVVGFALRIPYAAASVLASINKKMHSNKFGAFFYLLMRKEWDIICIFLYDAFL